MRKNLISLIIPAMAMMAASCSDDKQPWEQIPSSPITGDDAELTFNGDRSYGVMTIETRSESSADVTLSNVIPGYPEISIPVTMAALDDNTFSLSGRKQLSAPPVMMPLSKSNESSPIYTLTLTGHVTTSGKADVAVTSRLTEAAQGTITGKWVPEKMLPVSESLIAHAPVVVDIAVKGQPEKSAQLSETLSLLGGVAFYTTIGGIEFREDGNMIVDYSTLFDLCKAMNEAIDQNNGIYKAINEFNASTGSNLVYWYTQVPLLYVTPYIPGISYKIDVDNGKNPNLNDGATTEKIQAMLTQLGEMGVDTKQLLATFNQLNATGIPLVASSDGNYLKISITKEMFDPLMKIFAPALPAVDTKFKTWLSDPKNSAAAEIITTQLMPALGISSLTELAQLWETGIDSFTITINLSKE